MDSAPAVPIGEDEIEVEDEPTSRVGLPAAEALPELLTLPPMERRGPVFSHAPREDVGGVRRKRRMLALVTAAGVFGLLTLVAVVAVQPVALVHTSSGALRPEASGTKPVAGSASAATPEPPPTELALKGPAAQAEDPPIGRAVAPASQLVAEPSSDRAPSPAASAAPAAPPSSAPAGLGEAAVTRVAQALTQPAKPASSSPAVKRVPKRAPPPRRSARAAASTKAAAAPAPSPAAGGKLDCKQPFWIDEKGIRRLKMACL
jgi:hypothetical protein